MLQIGQRIGQYRITGQLGRGGMSIVYEAVHEELKTHAAIKVIAPDIADSSHWVLRFLNEARAVTLIGHPNIVKIDETGTADDGSPYIVMERLLGVSLDEHRKNAGGCLLKKAPHLGRQIALALQAAHDKGIVHRDLKPSNIMVVRGTDTSEFDCVKVLDFGIAKLPQEAAMSGQEQGPRTRTGARMGTPEYMAPEQCVEAASVSAKADVYALGVTLYELVSGRRPFLAEHAVELMTQHVRKQPRSLKRLAPKTPDALAALIHAMLRKRPDARPTMAEVATQLEEISLDGKDATSVGDTPATPALTAPSSSELADSEHDGELADAADFSERVGLFGNRRVSRWRLLRSAALLALTIGLTTAATLAATSWRRAEPIPARLASHPRAADSRPVSSSAISAASLPTATTRPQPAPPISVALPASVATVTSAPAPAQKPMKSLPSSTVKSNVNSAGKHSPAAASSPSATGKDPHAAPTLFEDLTPINP